MKDFEQIFQKNEAKYIKSLIEFLGFKSISANEQNTNDCKDCVRWLNEKLTNLGFKCENFEGTGRPVLVAKRSSEPGGSPSLLFYGHYDVQPIDPINAWLSDPFRPEIRNGRIYARGAQDNKGQLFYFLCAIEALLENSQKVPDITILLEGEEEIGSRALLQLLPSLEEKIKSEWFLICDTGTIEEELGTITMGLRGIIHLEIKLLGPKKDLHSGIHGGLVKNPATELCRLIATLHNPEGQIAIQGFYSDIIDISEDELRAVNNSPFRTDDYCRIIGIRPTGGENGRSPQERKGLRPSIDINGLTAGYQGSGSKTIIPSYATAKISSRLVLGQDPEVALGQIVDHLERYVPSDLELVVTEKLVGGKALRLNLESESIKMVSKIIEKITGSPPIYSWEGASVPIVSEIANLIAVQPILVGFGLEEDNIHSPNESFALSQFKKGFCFCTEFLQTIAHR